MCLALSLLGWSIWVLILTVVPYEGIVPIIVSHEAITALTTLLPVEEVGEEAPAPSSWG